MRDRTDECKILNIDHANVKLTLCTFFMDQFSITAIVWGHVITLPSDTVYDATLLKSGNLYTKFY